ncbi:CPBP family intramembrane glutamic endopeptidase [Leptolyngbya sp. Heron Island J]|uniref:CPBP family intramembrane glutamic endopeptidase n=1 Tax=Leptolyngbya sp. Heron Island J TaxID=1385935 RepID=UPI001376B7AC|nr:CPBP family intramembrane glutamic endopeptidase [Leptolyngbya sp. Heron Island J]
MHQAMPLKPMPFWMSLLFFGIPSLITSLSIYVGIPALARAGVPLFVNFLLLTGAPLALLLLSAFVAYRLEGNLFTWVQLKERFRLKPIKGKDWIWTLGLVVVSVGGYILLLPTARWLASFPLFEPPTYLPAAVNPRVMEAGIPTDFLGLPLRGQWWILGVYFLVLCFNIFGEELWWRGYILPRQEIQYGKWTWLIHGVLWDMFHVFWKWNLIALLPPTLGLSFVACRLKNTTPGIIVHWANNGLGLFILLLGVLGVTG